MKHKIFLPVVISLIILGVFLSEKLQPQLEISTLVILSEGGTNPGESAADFILEAVNGTDIKLSSFNGHKVVIVHFWSLDPGELTQLQTVRNFYGDKVEILGVSERANVSYVRSVANSVNFPVLIDKTGEAGQAFGVSEFPTTYFVDTNGTISDKKEGSLSEQELNEKVKNYLR
ncbi:MAG: TlpA family protein disulfide reductase [Candidatus Aenigmarchaeota archaeon]|nr:TlpA family protein disulfide reductase [Candidatus Aenigmarchaeota archaeon]